jgi:hypothetical protein
MHTQTALRLEPLSTAPAPRRQCEVVSIDELALARQRRVAPDAERSPLTLRCVHSGHLDGGGSCSETVPAEVAAGAWQADRLERLLNDGFFQFQWRGEAWIGYGISDGTVRGVYCPQHNAERTAHYYHQADAEDSCVQALSTV